MGPVGRLSRLPSLELQRGLELREARSLPDRALGLAWLDDLPPEIGLLIPRCRSVHTFGMRFPLDVVFLDPTAAVVCVVERLPPRRHAAVRRARSVVEIRGGLAGRFIDAGLEVAVRRRG
jgi:uncharacterized membrane protein (UPF0127 family)